MKRIVHIYLLLVLYSLSISSAFAEKLNDKLKSLQSEYHFSFKKLNVDKEFTEKYVIEMAQPVDHKDPGGQTFDQRIFISHVDFDRPVVFITEGYAAYYAEKSNYINELTSILAANQVCVEHRYFGESVPEPLIWQNLTVYNAASDHHRVIELIKEIYNGPIVNTGISKGGQTAMYHRYFYPDDVDATVGYVCPLNFSIEDKRVYLFLEQVGDVATRKRVHDYQLEMLKNKSLYIPEFKKLADRKNLSFSMGLTKAYELTVLEYSFAFWQWGTIPADSIPDSSLSPGRMVNHLNKVAGVDWISNEGIDKIRPFFYQAMTEIGFYGYNITPFREYVSYQSNPTFNFTAPDGIEIVYDPVPMQKVDCFIRHEAEKMVFIYGETDPWSSTAVDLTYNRGLLKVVKPGGSHLTRIINLPELQREQVIDSLKVWLNLN